MKMVITTLRRMPVAIIEDSVQVRVFVAIHRIFGRTKQRQTIDRDTNRTA